MSEALSGGQMLFGFGFTARQALTALTQNGGFKFSAQEVIPHLPQY